jgi:FkbM family methyltransferase
MLDRLSTLARSVRTAVMIRRDGDLPTWMRTAIARLVVRVENARPNRLPNPISLLGFRVGYLGEAQFHYLLNEVFVEGSYRFSTERPCPVVVDCGSNIGMSILFFKALYPQARIIGFEPDPDTFHELAENVRANRLASVELHNVALSAKDTRKWPTSGVFQDVAIFAYRKNQRSLECPHNDCQPAASAERPGETSVC